MEDEFKQEEMDLTLQRDRDLKSNVSQVVEFYLKKLKDEKYPDRILNAHEGYGFIAEAYTTLRKPTKMTTSDMADMLNRLPNGATDLIESASSLYNSAVDVAVQAINLAAECHRAMNDLYYGGDKTPLEEYFGSGNENDEDFSEAEEEADQDPEDEDLDELSQEIEEDGEALNPEPKKKGKRGKVVDIGKTANGDELKDAIKAAEE